MSYILEALEKSEQERQQRAVPDLQTQHTLYPGVTRSKTKRLRRNNRRLRPAILMAILIISTSYLFREHIPVALEIKITQAQKDSAQLPDPKSLNSIPTTSAVEPPPATTREQLTASEPAATETSFPDTPQEDITAPPPAPPTSQPEETLITRNRVMLQPTPILLADEGDTDSVMVVPALPFLEDLPPATHSNLPKFTFAGHTYSATPEDRLIIINSNIRREGDTLGNGLRLEEITWEGVILNFKGLRFQVITTSS